MAWIHVKALRVFVESVLRYGLPVNFQGMVLLPQKKTQKKLRDTLNQTYAHLDSAGGSGDVSEYKKVHTIFPRIVSSFECFPPLNSFRSLVRKLF